MSKMIQVRNVPDSVHAQVKARAALEGMTLSDFILRELERLLERPTRTELLRRLAQQAERDLQPEPAEAVRQERDAR